MAHIFTALFLLAHCLSISTLSAHEALSKPAIIGASLSDGYHHLEKFGGPKSDALALDISLQKILPPTSGKISNFGNRFCFIFPLGIAHNQIQDATKIKPSIIIAVDQLFWHLYGSFASTEQRLITFKNALKKLEPITCPLIIGNIPDASHSVHKMLAPSQIPDLKTITTANKLLTKWVKKRKQTTIIDIATFMKQCIQNREIKLKHITFPAGTTKQLLQKDMLHPTKSGVTAISHAIIESIQKITTLTDKQLNLNKPNSNKK